MTTTRTTNLLKKTRRKLYEIAGGSRESGDVMTSRLLTSQRTAYFRSPHFRAWVAAENAAGRLVLWLKDLDKTQASGDAFTFFFKWRIDNNAFTPSQLASISTWIAQHPELPPDVLASASQPITPHDLFKHWQKKEAGGSGIGLLDLYRIYWLTQVGLTREEKRDQVGRFAQAFADRVFLGVPEENQALTDAGVEVVIVSNGDQELLTAIAPVLKIKPENVVGSNLLYGDDGRATGSNHIYDIGDDVWLPRPQPGKILSFHWWLHENRERFGWKYINDDNFVIAGRDGDSASADGGMMIYGQPPAIGNFMIDTPCEPDRLLKFQAVAKKYGFGHFFTLVQSASNLGSIPE